MLTPAQQAVAVLTYVKKALSGNTDTAKLIQDPFFMSNLDYHFEALYEIYTGQSALRI